MPPLRSWAPLLVLLVPMIMAGHWHEDYLGLLDPAFYGGLVSVIAIAILPAMIALLVRGRQKASKRSVSRNAAAMPTRSGYGLRATCMTWWAIALP